MRKPVLPIDAALPSLVETLRGNSSLVLSAAPGAGKTTRLPPELLLVTDKKILVLEPRRIAAISASQRIAEENGWVLGQEVGYQVRFDNKSSPATRILFLTEALLLRRLLRDPDLSDVGCVVLDEFHERSLHVDLALGALKELQELSRPDLKIVVMSATLNAEPLSRFLGGAPVSFIPGKLFPLDLRLENKSMLARTGFEFTERIRNLLLKATAENDGDILCFLPGRGEIERLRQDLSEWAQTRNIALLPLHGQLNVQEQRAALSPLPGKRKIILATNVAESSLTVEGVRVVVDSGLARISQLHPRTGFESLDLVKISRASAIQRAGRAARLGPGIVYRAWNQFDDQAMKDFEAPEISRSDLAEPLLLLASLGVTKPENFSWFEIPPLKPLQQAKDFLLALGALDAEGNLTLLGQRLRDLPVHPRLGRLLLTGKGLGMGSESAGLAALLSEPGSRPQAGAYEFENDLWMRWEDWRRNPRQAKNFSVSRAADQLENLLERLPGPPPRAEFSFEEEMPALLLGAYADRLCRRRRAGDPQAKMAGGRGVKLHPDSTVKASEYFLALELAEGRDAAETLVYQAVGVSPTLVQDKILPLAVSAETVEWDGEKNRFWVIETKEWQGLSVGKEHRRPASAAEVEAQLPEVAFVKFAQILRDNELLSAWFSRLTFLAGFDEKFPVPTDDQVREALSLCCYGENSLTAVAAKDLVSFFETVLPPAQVQALARECPASWEVPTGNKIRLQYNPEQGVQVEVRLQELFGLNAAPIIGGQALTLVLLAPNYRPVQVTRDLPSFWKNAYPEVRKEMRLKYPKHSWPDNPLTALPQAKGRPRNLQVPNK